MSLACNPNKTLGVILAALLAAGTAVAADMPADAPKPGAAADESSSYSIGIAFATEWKDGGLTDNLSESALMRGIHDALGGKAMTTEDRKRASAFLQDAYVRLGARNKAAAQEFLARNAKEPGVKSTASGLQYLVLAPGDAGGPTAGPNDRVTVNYRGQLLNGTEFDSSYSHGKPATLRPNTVIAGLREALPLMSPHAKWKVFVPPDLAYGSTPPAAIPTNSLLVFEIEMLSVDSGARPGHANQ